jgi:hypothetical protein
MDGEIVGTMVKEVAEEVAGRKASRWQQNLPRKLRCETRAGRFVSRRQRVLHRS